MTEKTEKKLGKRTPLHQQKRTGIKDRPGYVRRLVAEWPGRVESFIEAGWQPVRGQENNDTDNRVQSARNIGTTLRPVINKDPMAPAAHGIWMEIPEELYVEDQREKSKVNDATERAYNPTINASTEAGFYGSVLKKD